MHNITLYMRISREVINFASQKFRLTPGLNCRIRLDRDPVTGLCSTLLPQPVSWFGAGVSTRCSAFPLLGNLSLDWVFQHLLG